MSKIDEMFQNALVEDLGNPVFLRLLNDGVEIDYNEANLRSHKDALISQPFKSYAFGQDRYFLTQSKFYECGLQAKLADVRVVNCPSNGYPITHIKFGRFLCTYHFGKSPSKISCPQTSMIRQQHASLNKELIAPKLPSMGSNEYVLNEETFSSANQIYINIIHGCHGNGRDFATDGFLRFAVPYYRSWIDAHSNRRREEFAFLSNINMRDVLSILIDKERAASKVTPIIDVAVPKVKRIIGDRK